MGKYTTKRSVTVQSDLSKVETASTRLREMIQQVTEYVDNVLVSTALFTCQDTVCAKSKIDLSLL